MSNLFKERFWFKVYKPGTVGWISVGVWFFHDSYDWFAVDMAFFPFRIAFGWKKKTTKGLRIIH